MRQNSEDPFFAVFSPFAPHGPAAAARRHRAEFLDTAPHRPPSYFGDLEGKPDWVKYYQAIAGPDLAEETDTMHIARLQSLLSVDEAVELILEKLEKLGLRDNTVVVFTSDHGFLLGEHWLRGKFNAYEESIRIPLIVQYPRRFPLPGIRDQMVLNHDLAPTLGEFAQAVVPADLDGVSMVPVLHSPNAPWRQHFLIETLGEFITAPSESVRTERWKYIETVAKAGVTEELYDLFVDPYEMTNLADDPSYVWVLADMDARLDLLRGP